MKKELLIKLDEVDIFFKKSGLDKKMNAKEEILLTLFQVLDIRDDELVSDEYFNHIVQKIGIEILTNETLYEEYTVTIGLFIEALMQSFYEKMEDSKALEELTLEVGEVFAQGLSNNAFQSLLNGILSKMELLAENQEAMSSTPIAKIVTQFTKAEYIEELLNRDRKDILAVLFGIVLSMISFMAMLKMKSFDNETFDDSLGLEEQIRAGFRDTPTDEELYNPHLLVYTLGSKPTCNLCDKDFSPKGLKRHLNSCIKKSYKEKDEELYYIIVKSNYTDYYLHIAIKPYTQLADLDSYLRDVWLECCGHMSEFSIGRNPLDMDISMDEVFSRTDKLEYIYDFGSSTYLFVEFVNRFKGKQSTLIETLVRNPMPKIKCSSCGSVKVVAVCAECLYEDKGNLCKKCLPKHECGLDMVLPYVNSPRYGECGYGHWDNTHNFSEKEFDKICEEVENNG